MCVLICEDLARQDPVTEVIRAVGPNLVFALLMDGPQLRNRWASRYASVLAEDPGCSVLSLTSLGMSRRSRPRLESGPVVDRSSVIALWLGHESVETTQMYLHADLQLKEEALSKVTPPDVQPGRFRPDDDLLAFLESL